jgi:hypothetical protein
MKLSAVFPCFVTVIAVLQLSQASAETVQTPADVLDGRPYLWVEGESAATILGTPGATWKVVTKGGPDLSVGSALPVLPITSNASGGALFAPVNDFSSHVPVAQYQLKFITPGTYQFFLRQSLYDSNNNNSFLNEDSIYLPPAFNKNSGTDWIGFEGLSFDEGDLNVDIPDPGHPLDPDGWKPQNGDHDRDGLLELANWGIKDEGTITFHTPSGTLSSNGNFNWYNRPAYQGTTQPANTFDGFFGMKNEFIVTPDMVGQTVTFDVGLREVNIAIDGFMFIQTDNIYPDNDILDIYSQAELDEAILPEPINADYNGDGTIDAADYVVWRKGESPDDTEAGYEAWKSHFGEPGAGAGGGGAVPEPAACGLLAISLAALVSVRRDR